MSEVLRLFDDSKNDVPDIRYVLPSTGKELFLRPFTTKEQKSVLKAMEKEDQILVGEAFDHLLRRCVVDKKFDPGKLISKDRECLLIKLRMESVKDDFTHSWKCGNCKQNTSVDVKLDDIKFEELVEGAPLSKTITLDGFAMQLVLGIATRDDEKAILQHAKATSGKGDISQAEVLNAAYASVIKGIKGTKTKQSTDENNQTIDVQEEYAMDVSFKDRIGILEKMSIDDRDKIKKFFDEIKNYGYDLNIGYKACRKCGHEMEQELEWLSFFIM